MDFFKLVKQRTSVRKYLKDKTIPREDLVKCIEAARLAPSACNAQPWKFILVDDPDLKDRICEKIFSGVYSVNKFAKNAAALVVVVSEKEKFLSTLGGRIRDTRYYLIDIGIACEHLVLQATELGIGSCWIGWFNEQPLKELLKIPSSKKVDIVISLGYFDETETSVKSRKSLDQTVSWNGYKGLTH
ncbi:MAG: nitroreductase family protein [Candidatus Omnitrophica bacterium]|nr:nitroreductase family protein [Candidatus Omnitrophota bacterium]